MVRCLLQWTAPKAFPPQLIHRPWKTHVAVMTADARLVVFHLFDSVAPRVAPSPQIHPTKARICIPDRVNYFQALKTNRPLKVISYTYDGLMSYNLEVDKLHFGHVFHRIDLHVGTS